MKLLLTSFGLSHLHNKQDGNANMFYRMPPVSMSSVGQQFLPDYVTLLLANKIIIDCQTYDRLNNPHHSYNAVAIMIKRLYDEGFVEIKDFDKVIIENKPLLEKMLEQDLKSLDLWIEPLKESTLYWEDFVAKFYGELRNEYFNIEDSASDLRYSKLRHYETHHEPYYSGKSIVQQLFLNHSLHHGIEIYSPEISINEILSSSSTKRRTSAYKQALKKYLIGYLSQVNTNILLSQTFETGFHDWYDHKPFYQEKFLRVAKESSPGEQEIENIKKLFEISFPEFSFWQPDNILKALKDKRIEELRQLVDSACKGKVEFDREFANRTLLEVSKVDSNIARFRNVVSYLTMPLGFIPTIGTPIQKVTEELIVKAKESKEKKGYQWFYMISDFAQKPTNKK